MRVRSALVGCQPVYPGWLWVAGAGGLAAGAGGSGGCSSPFNVTFSGSTQRSHALLGAFPPAETGGSAAQSTVMLQASVRVATSAAVGANGSAMVPSISPASSASSKQSVSAVLKPASSKLWAMLSWNAE